MHFSPKSLQNRFTFGHILSREVAWRIKNHILKMVIDPWPGVRSGGQCAKGRIWLIINSPIRWEVKWESSINSKLTRGGCSIDSKLTNPLRCRNASSRAKGGVWSIVNSPICLDSGMPVVLPIWIDLGGTAVTLTVVGFCQKQNHYSSFEWRLHCCSWAILIAFHLCYNSKKRWR